MSVEAETLRTTERLGSRLRRVLRSTFSTLSTRPRRSSTDTELSSSDGASQARLGQVLCGKYQLDSVLGVGGMATVYAATHRNRRRFAIKLLHAELSSSSFVRERFRREGYVTNSVNHAGAVAVFDDDVSEDGAAFLVMELLDGMSVEALWVKHRCVLPEQACLAIADQLLDVLAAAHASGILHRDLKPANLFVTRDGTLKVLDFGVARLRDESNSKVTQTGVRLGTPAYMAPEQAFGRGSELDATTDLWAVGATLFELLSGESVFETDDQHEIFLALASRAPRALQSVAPAVPERVAQVIDKALSVDKHARWPSAAAMREALRAASPEAAPNSHVLVELLASEPPPVQQLTRSASHMLWWALLLVVMLMLAALFASQ